MPYPSGHPLGMEWVLQGRQEGKERQFICTRLSPESCIAERERILRPSYKVKKDPSAPLGMRTIVVPSPWVWTAISRKDRRDR